MEKNNINARFEEEISKADYKKKKLKRQKAQRRHKVLSTNQKRALRKAQKASKKSGAQRKAKLTKKRRGRRGVYDDVNMEELINLVLEAKDKDEEEPEDGDKDTKDKKTGSVQADRPEDTNTGKVGNESLSEAKRFNGDLTQLVDVIVEGLFRLAKLEVDLGDKETLEVRDVEIVRQIDTVSDMLSDWLMDEVARKLEKKKVMII